MAMSPRLLRPIASAFSPKSLSGLYAWYDFSDSSTITLNSGNISQITDKSGNGKTLTQATALNQPTFTANAQNGKSVAACGGDQYLEAATAADWKFLNYSTEKAAVFFAFKTSASAEDQVSFGICGTQTEPGLVGWGAYTYVMAPNEFIGGMITTSGGSGYRITAEYDAVPLSVARAWCIRSYPLADDDALMNITNNGGAYVGNAGPDDAAQDQSPSSAFSVGYAPGNMYPFTGTIFEVLVYKRSTQLSDVQLTRVMAYLSQKWGLA